MSEIKKFNFKVTSSNSQPKCYADEPNRFYSVSKIEISDIILHNDDDFNLLIKHLETLKENAKRIIDFC